MVLAHIIPKAKTLYGSTAGRLADRFEAYAEGHTKDDAPAAREGLLAFTVRTKPNYRIGEVHEVIASALEDVEAGIIDRLIITVPPRHGKSELASIRFPAWCLGRHPEWSIIACSYGAHLAYGFSRKARNVVKSAEWPFESQLAKDFRGVQQWGMDAGGQYMAAGVGGPITGSGADVLIIDDPVKNADEADSEVFRESNWEWYKETAYPRLQAGGRIVVIGTRWHEDDLIGRLLAESEEDEDKDTWHVIDLPAIAEERDDGKPDPLGREIGEPLWPEGMPLKDLQRRRANMSVRAWRAQFQCTPLSNEGNKFKRKDIRYWHPIGHEMPAVKWKTLDGKIGFTPSVPLPVVYDKTNQSWDMTFKETKSGSFVVGQVWAKTGPNAYLLDQVRNRWDFVESVRAVQSVSRKWPTVVKKLIEDKANGSAIVNYLERKIPGLVLVNPEGGKEQRATAVEGFWEAHNVFIPHPDLYDWVEPFIAELIGFPTAKNDDQVDAMSQALIDLFTIGTKSGGVVSESYSPGVDTTPHMQRRRDRNGRNNPRRN